MTDDGIQHLLRLPRLEELDLLFTKMTPEGMNIISSLRELRTLVPGAVFNTDSPLPIPKQIEQGLANLSRLPKLEALDLRYIGLGGVDVRVMDIPTLRKLNVDSPRNREEIKQLREQIPELDPVTTERITIRAEIIRDYSFWNYAYLSNKMEIEID